MTYQVLARKWRPRDFASLVGQEHVVRALTHALDQQRLHHAYLFTGTRGVGKTTLSRILAKALNCETGITSTPCGVCKACREIDEGRFIDYVEMDAASNRGVDEMASLLERAIYAPVDARFKVYMIDEVHMLTNHAFNAMLKTLEEPPPHVKFILATTDPQKIPVTVLSRCLQFNLKQMPATHIVGHLQHVLTDEQIGFEAQALRLLARAADGSMRDALSLTDQAIAYAAGMVSEEAVRGMLGALDQSYLVRLLDAIAQADGAAVLAIADEMAARSLSFSVALQDLSSLLHRIAWAQYAPASVLDEWPEADDIRRFATLLAARDVQLYYQIATIGRSELSLAPDEYAGFTMTLLRMLAFQPFGDAPPTAPGASGARTRGAGSDVALAGAAAAPARAAQEAAALPATPALAASMPAAAAPKLTPAPTRASAALAPASVTVELPAVAAVVAESASKAAPVINAGAAPEVNCESAPALAPQAESTSAHDAVHASAPLSQPETAEILEAPAARPEPMSEGVVAAGAEAAVSPARAALDALRSAGLRAPSERKRNDTPAPRVRAASAAVPDAIGAAGKTYGPRETRPRPAAPASAPSTSAAASDHGGPAWDAIPPDAGDDFYPVPTGYDTLSFDGDEGRIDDAMPDHGATPATPSFAVSTAPIAEAPPQIDLAPLGYAGDWPKLAAELPLKGLAQQLAHQSELTALQGDTLKLRAPTPLTDAAQVAKLKTALAEHLGRPVSLEVEAGAARWSAAAAAAAERARQQQAAERAVAEDSFIQALIRDFDAKIIAGSIRPIQ